MEGKRERGRRGQTKRGVERRWRGEYGLSIQISALCYFFHHPVLASFILTDFLVFPWTHLLLVNAKMPVFSRAEFCLASLSTKFEEAQYNIVMIGGNVEESLV